MCLFIIPLLGVIALQEISEALSHLLEHPVEYQSLEPLSG